LLSARKPEQISAVAEKVYTAGFMALDPSDTPGALHGLAPGL
jgi:hypothetical protein